MPQISRCRCAMRTRHTTWRNLLEVAEHIPPECADIFVESLTWGLAPVIMFSAAVPGQGGTLHLNEQWPAYWASKFAQHGYVLIDCLRPQLWD